MNRLRRHLQSILSKPSYSFLLFTLSLLVYAIVRLIHLEDYPIYFFTDEAIQTVLAADFIRDGFRNYDGTFFPTYFQNVYEYNLNLSVYLQIIPYLLFGKAIVVTRATSALFTLIAPLSLGLVLKNVFEDDLYWVAVPILSTTPAWFLHSRTAFETSIMVALYAAFLCTYLLYRTRSPDYLYLAALLGASAFYAYGPGQIIMLTTAATLFISDFRYHLRHRRTLLFTLGLLAALALPYLRFQIQIPGKHTEFLRLLHSHWLQDIPLGEKFWISLRHYLVGLSPMYWFFPSGVDLPRHEMDAYGHISILAGPFILAGLVLSLKNFRNPRHRTLIAAVLAIPFGGIVAGPGITRLLSMSLLGALLASLGLSRLVSALRQRISYHVLATLLFTIGTIANFYMLSDALRTGPTWSRDYGLSGMQYGAKQVFSAVEGLLEENHTREVFVSPTWANGVDVLRRFFFLDDAPVHIANTDAFQRDMKTLEPDKLFVLTEAEYEDVLSNRKFQPPIVERVMRYPDGTPGFYFVRLAYSERAERLFAEEAEARRIPVVERVTLGEHRVEVEHPRFDMGEIEEMFDADPFTMVRTEQANPAALRLSFEPPMQMQGLRLTTGSMDVSISARLSGPELEDPIQFTASFLDLPDDPTVELTFEGGPYLVSQLELLIEGSQMDDPTRIHIRELTLE